MGKQVPNLKLVSADAGQDALGFRAGTGFEFISLSELSAKDRSYVQRIVDAACPKAGVIAVARAQRVWDLRPVVALSDENGPSVIRSLGPKVAFNSELSLRVRETLQRLERFPALASELRSWGEVEGQIYFRRTLVPDTLAHLISSAEQGLQEAPGGLLARSDSVFELIHLLVEQVSVFHSHGVIHGHITTSNIALNGDGMPSLLDSGAGAALVQADPGDADGQLQSMAPELLKGAVLTVSADVYGLGQVMRRLFMKLRQQTQFSRSRLELETAIDRYSPVINSMVSEEPVDRPGMNEVHRTFEKLLAARIAAPAPRPAPAAPDTEAAPRGRIVKPGQVAARPAAQPNPQNSEVMEKPEPAAAPVAQSRPEPAPAPLSERIERPKPQEELQFEPDAGIDEIFLGDEDPSVIPPLDLDLPDAGELNIALDRSEVPDRALARRPETSIHRMWWVYVLGFACLMFCVWSYVNRPEETVELGPQEMVFAWRSGVPSKMAPVAELAVQEGGRAEELVLTSVRGGANLPAGVNPLLLRIAFDDRWEQALSDDDRRLALALGLSGLIGNTSKIEFGALQDRHPGILLAIAACAGDKTNRFLKDIPASSLGSGKLPPPFGPAFDRLAQMRKNTSLADREVQFLARIGTAGIERKADLVEYMRGDDGTRLQALALLVSLENEAARLVLDTLLNHPNLVFDSPQVVWGRTWKLLTEWPELEAADQLFVLAGIPPRQDLTLQPVNIGKMFNHPSSAVRKYAVEQALDNLRFKHPAAADVFLEVSKNPELLTGDQLFTLSFFLENPEKAAEPKIKEWFETKPPPQLVRLMLMKTAAQKTSSVFETLCAIYLKQNNWEPSVEELALLSTHPDQYSRLFSYNQIYERFSGAEALKLLNHALGKEFHPPYRVHLEEMITQLTTSRTTK